MGDAAKRSVDNLLLLCTVCHDLVDEKKIERVYDLETVRQVKIEHEKLVEELLSLMESNTSLVLRALGSVRTKDVGLDRLEVAAALAKRGRRPVYLEGLHRREIEVDLSAFEEDTDDYWWACRRKLTSAVSRALVARTEGVAQHLTVFALMRTPLLVLLGWLLDDTTRVDVIQRSRKTGWMPDVDAADHEFEVTVDAGVQVAADVVLVLSLTGAVPPELLSSELRELPQVRISPARGYDAACLNSETSRRNFDRALSQALGLVEQVTSRPQTVHLVCGAPIYACVEVGRALQPEICPHVIVYDAPDGAYLPALKLDAQDRP